MCKTLKILNLCCLALCAVFSLLQIPTAVDLSFSAIWLALAFTAVLVYFAFYTLQLKSNPRFYKVVNKLYEYVPYFYLIIFVLRRSGKKSTSFAYDLICVIVWLLVAISSFVVSRYFLSEKYFYKKNTGFKKPAVHKKTLGKKAAKEGLEWVDAFVQAVFAIILLNIFIFQLYVIPSESMVDEFLVGDRVLVFKISSGPKFPMTNVGLKDFKKYERGDITVFHNPQYPDTKEKELKNFYSQIVFMLTLTKVNLNTDEFGNPMADPLVKRVCAVGGEQLVMLDGILYRRTKDSPEFEPVKEDLKWANWNLNELPGATKVKVKYIPFTQKQYETLLETENDRRNFDVKAFKNEAQSLSNRFARLASRNVSQKSQKLRSTEVENLLSEDQRDVYNLFSDNESVVKLLLSSPYA
ncbi:MAG: signal peptidase I, partial [Treponemataceae bacterium]|nr:signal peptidase I [Treponemataceae bacterium]